MEIRNILSRKSAKLLVLLLINMLVVTVSAAMYYSLSMSSTIDVYAADVYFVVGTDNGTAPGLFVTMGSQNTTATITGLRAYPNASLTYTDPIRVRNNGTTPSNIRLAPDVDPSVNPEDFVYVKFLLNATAVGDRRWLNYTSNGSSWTIPSASIWTAIGADTQWPIVIITKANATATADESVTIGITVDVD